MQDLTPQAIDAALSSDWDKAVDLNSKILEETPDNTDCLNRLGKAYLELGDNKKAATIFRKVLKINRYDQIAKRNLDRTTQSATKKGAATPKTAGPQKSTSPTDFLEEPGRTKLIQLVNLAATSVLLKLNQADGVNLSVRRRTVVATDEAGNYLGSLPDDVGHRLAFLIKGGNTYSAYVKSVTKSQLIIFVRETRRAKKFSDTASFVATNNDYFSFLRDEVPPTPVVTADEEAEEDRSLSGHLHDDEEETPEKS